LVEPSLALTGKLIWLALSTSTCARCGVGAPGERREEPPPGIWHEIEDIAVKRSTELALLVEQIRTRPGIRMALPKIERAPRVEVPNR
jgi:hypothetical protein